MSSLSSNLAPDWVGRRVRIVRGRLAGRIGTAIQFAEDKFRIVLPGLQTIVKHAGDVDLLPSGNSGVVRGRARGGFYLVALTGKTGDVMVIMKKAEDIRATLRASDTTMAAAATILMEIMDRRMKEGVSENMTRPEGQKQTPTTASTAKPSLDLDLTLIKDVPGARIPFAARAK